MSLLRETNQAGFSWTNKGIVLGIFGKIILKIRTAGIQENIAWRLFKRRKLELLI